MTPSISRSDAAQRRTPPLGGLSATFLGLELRRMMRNRRTVIFTLILPGAFFLMFGANAAVKSERAGVGNVTAYIMISMAVYGAMLATTSGGAMVSIERAVGWSRQLRLTPLNPVAYLCIKLVLAMSLGLASVVVVCAVGLLAGAELPTGALLTAVFLAWSTSIVFAAFGLFMGYLLPSENVMQLLGPVLALFAFAGGLFIPLDQLGRVFGTVAQFTPVYGVGVIARWPLQHDGSLGIAVLNVAAWTAVFAVGAGWRFRGDTARV
ncbi:MAG: ABC transporter permease [Geodermatophilaceae bacterium]